MRTLLIVTAVDAERDSIERGLTAAQRAVTTVISAGVGAASAAAATASALAAGSFDAVASAGIGGAFPDAARLGDLLIARRIIAADLGAEDPTAPTGFRSVDELGFGSAVCPAVVPELAGAVIGDLLTVTTATGTATRAAALRTRYPDAVGEAMEGYGVAVAAARFGLRAAELRAVSNPVGPRDRSAWRIAEAFAALSAAAAPWVDALLSDRAEVLSEEHRAAALLSRQAEAADEQ